MYIENWRKINKFVRRVVVTGHARELQQQNDAIKQGLSHEFVCKTWPAQKWNRKMVHFMFITLLPSYVICYSVNQMFGDSSQPTAERAVMKSLSTVQTTKQCMAVVGSWEEPPSNWLTVAKNDFVGRALNFRVRMLLKGAVNNHFYGDINFALWFIFCHSLITWFIPHLELYWSVFGQRRRLKKGTGWWATSGVW